jgi:hypothetical protein
MILGDRAVHLTEGVDSLAAAPLDWKETDP